MSGGLVHEHDNERDTGRDRVEVSRLVHGVQDLRHGVRFGTAALYVLCDMMNWPLFTYHPATNRLDLFHAPPRQGKGPVMYWYGWTASSMLGAAALGVLAALLPEHVTRKIPLALVWIVPVLAIPLLFYSLITRPVAVAEARHSRVGPYPA